MERRAFLRSVMGTALSRLVGGCSGEPFFAARVTVSREHAGRMVPTDFVGLSYESAVLAQGNFFAPYNESILNLMRLLGRSGVIRIGGNTSERTVWRSDDHSVADHKNFVITPAAIDRLAGALRSLDWQLIYGLNLARGRPDEAAAEAAYVANAVGPRLLAFQIGNEPDGFGQWTKVRSSSYDVEAYLNEWSLFQAAIDERVPNARFAGPDVTTGSDWMNRFAAVKPHGLTLLTQHYYADGPAGAWHVTLANLMRSSARAVPLLGRLRLISREYGLPYRIVEANSVFNEGQPGVSDTLGAALWGLELMSQVAIAGGAGINFHAGVNNHHPERDKAYTPIARGENDNYRAAPLYYGMLMFAIAGRGRLVPTQIVPEHSELCAFACDEDGSLRVCLINKDPTRPARLTIVPDGGFYEHASVLRLMGPSIDSISGVALGGAAVDDAGRWLPIVEEISNPENAEIVIGVEPSSAALIQISSNRGNDKFPML